MAHRGKFPPLRKALALAKFRKPAKQCLDITAQEIGVHALVPAPASESAVTLAACRLSALLGLQSIILLSKLIGLILYLPLAGFLLSPTPCLDRQSGCISLCLTSAYKTLRSCCLPLNGSPACLVLYAVDKKSRGKKHTKTSFCRGDCLGSLLSLTCGRDFAKPPFPQCPLHTSFCCCLQR